MANKKLMGEGLAGLMSVRPTAAAATTGDAPEKPGKPTTGTGNYKTVCYSIPPEIADRIKAQALKERRTIGAVVAQAFSDYLDKCKD